VMLEHERFGSEVVLVGDDAGLERELLRSFEGIGGGEKVGGEAAGEVVAGEQR